MTKSPLCLEEIGLMEPQTLMRPHAVVAGRNRVKLNSVSNVSRRTLLKSGAFGGLIIPAGAAALAQETSRLSFNLRQWTFSLSERDRRWAAIRAIMARPQWNLDAIITPQSDLNGNTTRSLTQIGMSPGGGAGPEVIFPRDNNQAVYVQVSGARFRDFWKAHAAGWMTDNKLMVSAAGGPE